MLQEFGRSRGLEEALFLREAITPHVFHAAVEHMLKKSTGNKNGEYIFPIGLLDLLSLPLELRERVEFALGDSLDLLSLEIAKNGKPKDEMSRITLIGPSTQDPVTDRVTARADDKLLTFSTTVNGRQVENCGHNESLKQTLCRQMTQFASRQLSAYMSEHP